ncbi:3',5'-cyclic AMP phosphodiesterase CpdA [Halopseudomonas litoralis]|uniref:3',5'-cyclic AMP phosphodiesterase CpdA n=1 Tax=Halopseudomonas litoralis TaxID=797277 RepID=A0A1H1V081_9GAMM|nr:metallophosphoesterase [Halopseudomonas litoralis]SDS78187.1 3',5'-cyclic AMP phosphodiesterase CpdA [Halopseudomonas litoralis]
MSRILHFSDLHFGTEDAAVAQALLQLAEQQQPDLYLLSGDITQRARRSQFAAARAFIQLLPAKPLLAVPGNHDLPLFNLPLRMLNPYGNYRRVFGNELEPEFERDDLLVVGVNTTRAGRHKDGEVSAEQIQRVAQRLQRAHADQLRVVMLHHPIRAVEESDVSNLLIGREQAVPSWIDAGVDLLLGGHIHLPYVVPLQGNPDQQAWAIQAGTGISQRVRGNIPNSVNLIEHDAHDRQRRCQITRWDYASADKRFIPVETTELQLSGSANA